VYTVTEIGSGASHPDGPLLHVKSATTVTSAFPKRFKQYAPSQPFELRQGDKVQNTKTLRRGIVEVAPISRTLKVYDLHPPYRDGVPATALEEYEEHHPGTYEITSRKEPF
jgi:hypothetical protein